MGQDSKIEWTHHTFNPWIGCTKVSPGCANCYAEAQAKYRGWAKWGPDGIRKVKAESGWAEPLRWDWAAKAAGERRRVFCASLADVFEDRLELKPHRARLFGLIVATPRLDWLILTKRPERMADYFRSRTAMWKAAEAYRDLIYGPDSDVGLGDGLAHWPPRNVWPGTSVEDRKHGLPRVDVLRETPTASVRLLSVEPLLEDLGPIDLTGISWVIVGGESGPKARPMHPAWARSIRDQCQAAGVPFFFKQWGEWAPSGMTCAALPDRYHRFEDGTTIQRVGKKAAGRVLDGRTWDELPATKTEVPADA